jgi:D-alanyl-D-alanine carboxypeptidase/D-alanyl-D-alanine-endopeptidase (penicillin-binding protein 4)
VQGLDGDLAPVRARVDVGVGFSGSETSRRMGIARSIFAMQNWLTREDMEFKELVLENGAGLSRIERISAAHMAQLLEHAAAHPLSAELQASLPILGADGSVQQRLSDSPAARHAHLKTGTLEGVKTLAGYVRSMRNKDWVVVFFINHPNAKHGQDAQDALVEFFILNNTTLPASRCSACNFSRRASASMTLDRN